MKGKNLHMKRFCGLIGLLAFFFIALSPLLSQGQDDYASSQKLSSEFGSYDLKEKIDSWKRLSPAERKIFLNELNDSEIANIITAMGADDKVQLFQSLDPQKQANMFLNLEKADQELIFERLSDTEKQQLLQIFDRLNDTEKQRLLQKHPGLSSIFDTQKPTRQLIDKPVPPIEKAAPPSRIEPILPIKKAAPPRPVSKKLCQDCFPRTLSKNCNNMAIIFSNRTRSPLHRSSMFRWDPIILSVRAIISKFICGAKPKKPTMSPSIETD